ncbi:MAG: alpha/beta hydrolase [Myxococcota bacterium]
MKYMVPAAMAAAAALVAAGCSDDDTTSMPTDAPPGEGVETMTFAVDDASFTIAVIEDTEGPPLPAAAEPHRISFGEEEIFALDIPGVGAPIVLMHGLPDHTYLYDRLFPELEGRRVIAFDHVGWGRSTKPSPDDYDYRFVQQRAELEAVLDYFDVDRLTLVVHDLSGPPGIDFARAEPERVDHLVLLNTFYGRAEGALIPPKGVELHSDPRLDAAERAVQLDPAAIESYFRFQMDEFIVSAPDEGPFIDGLWSRWRGSRPAFIAMTNRLIAQVVGLTATENQALGELTVPVDIVFGVDDPYLNVDVAQHFADNIPGSALHLIDNAGHFVQVDAPATIAPIVRGEEGVLAEN